MAEFVLALVLLLFSAARCPDGWWLAEGVKPDGRYSCHTQAPLCCGEPDTECAVVCPVAKVRRGRIWCTGGSIPVQGDDGRTVGCQMPH